MLRPALREGNSLSDRPGILLVEDNVVTSRTLVLFLTAEKYNVQCAFNGRDGIDFFRQADFDLVLLDLMLPDVDGLRVCKTIRAESNVPVIMLTARTTEDDIVEGLESGADDYVCKPFGSRELLARVRCCLRRPDQQTIEEQSVFRVGDIEVGLEHRTVMLGGNVVKLTKSEFDILAVLIRQPGRVFTRHQLIDQALGPDFDGFDRTIDTHVWSLRKKLGEPQGKPRYIVSETGVGYRMSNQDEP